MNIAWLINYNNKLYDPSELPSLEQIEQMDRKRDKALDAVELFDSGHSVKCQKCGNAVPIVGKMSRPKNDTVVKLETRQRFMENHPHLCKKEDLEAVQRFLLQRRLVETKPAEFGDLPPSLICTDR